MTSAALVSLHLEQILVLEKYAGPSISLAQDPLNLSSTL